jgi:hypothetical protein
MKVSGQVKAEDKEALVTKEGTVTDAGLVKHGFPSNVELGAHIVCQTKKEQHKVLLMGEGTDAKPVLEKGQLLKIILKNNADLAWLPPPTLVGSKAVMMGLETSDGEPYAGGFYFIRRKKHVLANAVITLHNKEDKDIVAVCMEERSLFYPLVRSSYSIYAAKPRFEGDSPVSGDAIKKQCTDLVDVTLYNWAKIVHPGSHMVSLWTEKQEFEPTYRGHHVHQPFGGGTGEGYIIKPDKDTSIKPGDQKNKTVLAALHARKIINKGLDEDSPGWDITIAPGVDPVLIVCIAAVFDAVSGINL